jgi:hypothetical protein
MESVADIPWYSEASLVGGKRIFCAGSLAQCLRKWSKLAEVEQQTAYIAVGACTIKREKLERFEIAALAAHPDLKKV